MKKKEQMIAKVNEDIKAKMAGGWVVERIDDLGANEACIVFSDPKHPDALDIQYYFRAGGRILTLDSFASACEYGKQRTKRS